MVTPRKLCPPSTGSGWPSPAGNPLFRKACDLAGLTRWEWEVLLGEREIRQHYSDDELDQDITYATSGQ